VLKIQTAFFEKVLLIILGVVIGAIPIIILCVIYFGFYKPASKFETVAELHKTLAQKDEHDLNSNGSVSLRSIIIPHPSKYIIYKMAPNLDVKFQQVHLRTNSWGFRGSEITEEKPTETLRVAVLGDSFAFGWGVKEEEGFVFQLQNLLQKKLSQRAKTSMLSHDAAPSVKRIEVLNFGVPGYSTFQEIAYFKREGIKFSPDVVVVYFIENDFGLPYFLDTQDGILESATSFVSGMFQHSKPEEIKLHRELVAISDANRALIRLERFLKKKNISGLLFLNPGGNHAATLKKLWVYPELKVLDFIDLYESYNRAVEEGSYDPKTLKLPDDPHPSALKHRILAQLMAPYVLKKIGLNQAEKK
jgi:hypothetical protein